MAKINFRSADSNNIVIEKEKKTFGSIMYKGFFSSKLSAISANNEIYDLVRTSIWKDTYELCQGNETFFTIKLGLTGKIQITNTKSGQEFHLSSKSWLNKQFALTDNSGELLFDLNVTYGFLVTIKDAVMETTEKFDSMKDQFLICVAVIFSINEQIKKTFIIT